MAKNYDSTTKNSKNSIKMNHKSSQSYKSEETSRY